MTQAIAFKWSSATRQACSVVGSGSQPWSTQKDSGSVSLTCSMVDINVASPFALFIRGDLVPLYGRVYAHVWEYELTALLRK